jgi:NlpC/P60 family putative phage cell wall peptidase
LTATRAAVVAEAESWIGTPYHPHGRLRGVGVDCAMLLLEVYTRAGAVDAFDPGDYPPDFGLHRSEELFLSFVERHGTPVHAPQAGDVALFVYGRCYSHGAIMAGPTRLIHAVMRDHAVVRGDLFDISLIAREPKFFTLWPEVSDGR